MIQGAVHDDAIEPGAEVGAPFESIEMEKRVEETFLDDVLGILLAAGPLGATGIPSAWPVIERLPVPPSPVS